MTNPNDEENETMSGDDETKAPAPELPQGSDETNATPPETATAAAAPAPVSQTRALVLRIAELLHNQERQEARALAQQVPPAGESQWLGGEHDLVAAFHEQVEAGQYAAFAKAVIDATSEPDPTSDAGVRTLMFAGMMSRVVVDLAQREDRQREQERLIGSVHARLLGSRPDAGALGRLEEIVAVLDDVADVLDAVPGEGLIDAALRMQGHAVPAGTRSTDLRMDERVSLWNAINRYTASCGGDPSHATISQSRMEAVAAVERTVEGALARSVTEPVDLEKAFAWASSLPDGVTRRTQARLLFAHYRSEVLYNPPQNLARQAECLFLAGDRELAQCLVGQLAVMVDGSPIAEAVLAPLRAHVANPGIAIDPWTWHITHYFEQMGKGGWIYEYPVAQILSEALLLNPGEQTLSHASRALAIMTALGMVPSEVPGKGGVVSYTYPDGLEKDGQDDLP